jgi:hypothetical protein
MIKKFISIFSVFCLVALLVPVAHATEVSHQLTALNSDVFYAATFDNLVMDLTIDTATTDYLDTFTIKNNSTDGNIGLEDVRLYLDTDANGFQGWTIDQDLGVAEYNEEYQYWYWTDLHLEVPANGLRFFATIETSLSIGSNRSYQFYVPEIVDANSNGEFEEGDLGLFFESLTTYPDEMIIDSVTHMLSSSSSDYTGPRVFWKNLATNQVVTGNSKRIEAYVRDVGIGGVKVVEFEIDGQWVNAIDDGDYVWTYQWQELTAGQHTLGIRAYDNYGNVTNGDSIYVNVFVSQTYSESNSTLSLSKTVVKADGEDQAVFNVSVKDEDNNPIPNFLVYLQQIRVDDTVNLKSKATDVNGEAELTVSTTVEQMGTFQVVNDDMEILSGYSFVINFESPIEEAIDYMSGRWVKLDGQSAVYHLDSNNVRHAYPTLAVWASYYGEDFSSVETITSDEMAGYSLGNNVPFQTGSLFKIPSVPKVYKVETNGVIRWLKTAEIAASLYGSNWPMLVKDLPESFLTDYTVGVDIE